MEEGEAGGIQRRKRKENASLGNVECTEEAGGGGSRGPYTMERQLEADIQLCFRRHLTGQDARAEGHATRIVEGEGGCVAQYCRRRHISK